MLTEVPDGVLDAVQAAIDAKESEPASDAVCGNCRHRKEVLCRRYPPPFPIVWSGSSPADMSCGEYAPVEE